MHIVTKGWGYEMWIENNNEYCGKRLCVLPGKYCSIHYHVNKKETFYVLSGSLRLDVYRKIDHNEINKNLWLNENEIVYPEYKLRLHPGDSFTIDRLHPHQFTALANNPCEFIEFSTHHDDNDSYRLVKGD